MSTIPHIRRRYKHNRSGWLMLCLICLLPIDVHPGSGQVIHDHTSVEVDRSEILEAMRQARGYDPTATTNGARFQAEVLLRLAHRAKTRHLDGPLLFIDHADWFYAFLDATRRTETTAPVFALLSYRHRQDILIDYGDSCVIDRVEEGPEPHLAINVRIWWEKRPKEPSEYAYLDTLSTPTLKVTNHRIITYRLLDFKEWIVYDEIEGLTGRPTSGVLGFLFRLIGEGHVVESRMAISPDGLQVSRTRAKKAFFGVQTTVTVNPDGVTHKDIPEDRPDLQEVEALLKQPMEIKYRPF